MAASTTTVLITVTIDGITQTATQAVAVTDKAELNYTGNMQEKEITVNGARYMLYTFTESGTLTITKKAATGVDLWLCGGGANGQTYRGGGGGYFAQKAGLTMAKGSTYTITIGGAQGTTSIAQGGSSIAAASGTTTQNGASGGGGGGANDGKTGGTGGGASTRPFSDGTNFASLPCAGGGGCGDEKWNDSAAYAWYPGGDGGTDGGNGNAGATTSTGSTSKDSHGGSGGATGGGKGQAGNGSNWAQAATFYGSGGGGGRISSTGGTARAAGYQGVLYIRISL